MAEKTRVPEKDRLGCFTECRFERQTSDEKFFAHAESVSILPSLKLDKSMDIENIYNEFFRHESNENFNCIKVKPSRGKV